ncbi:MAG: hypothetical protein P1P80_01150 [ANME-2 cluster archaeon]|nr:hypothetical protein [ANME-2 cluster archaeon]
MSRNVGTMTENEADNLINELDKKAQTLMNELERSKKYRAGIAALAQRAVETNNTAYLDAAERFTRYIIDEHDTSKAFVDIVRAMGRIASSTSNVELLDRALALSLNTNSQQDRSNSLQGVSVAMAEVGVSDNDTETIEASKQLAGTIEYDTYRSSALRGIARALQNSDNEAGALEMAEGALDIIDRSLRIEHHIYRSAAYVDLTVLFLDLGKIDKARQCIASAQSAAGNLTDEFERSSMFGAIAETLVRMGARIKDHGLLEAAVQSYNKVTREYYRTSTRRNLTNVLGNVNEIELLRKIQA